MSRRAAVPGGWRRAFRRHERAIAAGWLCLVTLTLVALATAPVRVAVLAALQAAVDRWEARWNSRLAFGESLVTGGQYAEAAAYLERLDRAFPARNVRHGRDKERELLLRLLARSQEALGQTGRTMATYDRLVAFEPLNYHNHYLRARAAERLLSGWALAPEARDGYAQALQLFPSHLPSVRGYIDYYTDRGEFIPVVQAYEAYLEAFLVQWVQFRLGDDSLMVPLQADGLPHEVELPLVAPAGAWTRLILRSGGFALRVESIVAVPGTSVGVVGASGPVEVASLPVALEAMEASQSGTLRPVGDSTGAAFAVPPLSTGVGGIRLRVRMYKPVDQGLWDRVGKAYRNLLDHGGLAAAAERTLPLATVEAADAVLMRQQWAREGLEVSLHDGK